MENSLFRKTRLIALDMDGTLLDGNGLAIPQENILALREAHDAGIGLVIASGRLPDDAAIFAMDIDLPMRIIALNGTCRLDRPGGELLDSIFIEKQTMRRVKMILDESKLNYGLFSGNRLVVRNEPGDQSEAARIWGCNIFRPESRCVYREALSGADEVIRDGISKIVVFDDPIRGGLDAVRQQLSVLTGLELSSSWPLNMEINPAGCSKGTALKRLAQSLGIPMDEVMAIGDNDNDIPMLNAAGISVAMGNATPSAVAAAGYQTVSNIECGVAAAIRTIALGQPDDRVKMLRDRQ